MADVHGAPMPGPDMEHDAPPLEYTSTLKRFLHHDLVGSGLLLLAATAAVIVANVGFYDLYHEIWATDFGFSLGEFSLVKDLHHWVNDGLMAIFFFLVGLEIKRELVAGELASVRKAILPVLAAAGGMFVPAIVYTLINGGGEGAHGWGIPMATDIAFAAGCLAIMRKRVPAGLMVFLVALAIVDDLGAVAVIAIFYSEGIAYYPLIIGSTLIIISFILGLLGVRVMWPYAIFGMVIWVAFLESGVHATIAGVLLAFSIPADARYKSHLFAGRMRELLHRFVAAEHDPEFEAHERDGAPGISRIMVNQRQQALIRHMNWECHHVEAPLQRLEHNIEPLAVFVILPIFAFANAGVQLDWSEIGTLVLQPVTLGVFFGLLLGKPLGIFLASYLTIKAGWAELPRGVTWPQIIGVGFLAGIGFTMSLFINGLAFAGLPNAEALVAEGKIGTFLASISAAVVGLALITLVTKPGAGAGNHDAN
ncbi:MAG: Na+/H+ antiporter NhaA [Candidatus Hydrogenedentales bacterium]